MSRGSPQNLGRLNLDTLDTRFAVFLVRHVAKRCRSVILSRTLRIVVFGKDIPEINTLTDPDIGANAEGYQDRSIGRPTECELEFWDRLEGGTTWGAAREDHCSRFVDMGGNLRRGTRDISDC